VGEVSAPLQIISTSRHWMFMKQVQGVSTCMISVFKRLIVSLGAPVDECHQVYSCCLPADIDVIAS